MLFRTLLRLTKKLGACHIHLQMEAAFGKAVMSDMGGRIQHRCNALSAADIRGHFCEYNTPPAASSTNHPEAALRGDRYAAGVSGAELTVPPY